MKAPLRYFGGKWRLAPWIITHFPPHKLYVEPFGGGASVLLRKEPSEFEVYNDIDQEIWNFFTVLRDPFLCQKVVDRLTNTPYSRDEYSRAFDATECPVERAARMVIRSKMQYGSKSTLGKLCSGFTASSRRKGTLPGPVLDSWKRYPDSMISVRDRLRDVLIENRDAIQLMQQYDSNETLFYCDPPYVHSARSSNKEYSHEMSEESHLKLLRYLKGCAASVVISGYGNAIYDNELAEWERVTKETYTIDARRRTEVLWIRSQL
jgi:DNA adenine methylase